MVKYISLALIVAVAWSAPAAETASPNIDAALQAAGFEAGAKEKILKGQILSKDLAEGSAKELAAVLAFRVRAPLAKILDAAHGGQTLQVEPDILAIGKADTGLDKLGYTPAEAGEALTALNAAPGAKLNFSSAEIERWRALKAKLKNADPRKDPQALEAVNAEYRAILADRLAAYQKGGVKAIAPYTRGKSESSPAEELALANKASYVSKAFPGFYKATTDYPAVSEEQIEHEYLWVKQLVEKRPVMILSHRMYLRGADYAVAMQRQIYVGGSYNSQQSIFGAREEGDGVIALYGNRCFTDQVAGALGAIKHGIGRGQMIGELTKHFDDVRKLLEK